MSCALEDASWCTGLPPHLCMSLLMLQWGLFMHDMIVVAIFLLFIQQGWVERSVRKGANVSQSRIKNSTLDKACIYHPTAAKFEHNHQ